MLTLVLFDTKMSQRLEPNLTSLVTTLFSQPMKLRSMIALSIPKTLTLAALTQEESHTIATDSMSRTKSAST